MKKEELIEYSTGDLLRTIAKYLKPYQWRFVGASFLRLAGDIANLYPAIAVSSIVTFFTVYKTGESLRSFWIILGFWAIAVSIRIIGNYSGKHYIHLIAEKTALDAQLNVLGHLFRLDIAWHEKENVGNKLKKLQRGSAGIDRIIRMWVNSYIEIVVNFVGVLFILGRSNFGVAGLMVLFIVSYFTLSFAMLRKVTRITKIVNEKDEDINGLVYQALNNIRSVKIAGISDKLHKLIQEKSDDIFAWIKLRVFGFQMRGTILGFWGNGFRLAVTAFIALSIFNGHSDVGFLILFNMYFMRIQESISELSSATQDLIINKLSIARMEAILDETEIESEEADKNFPIAWKKLTIKNLSFAYGTYEVLRDINFEIRRGERVGIVGLSGAGKSTLFKLLLKENENYQGEILFDNIPLRKIKKASFYENMGVVLQDTEVFNFSLRDNITIATNKRVKKSGLAQALAISHVDDYINKLANGLDTFIGEKGVKLSGGEKQRLGIARAIYKQPQILFLDEATSHLDLESEEKIRDSLHAFFLEVTAVVIAHRLTTIREMDKIILIADGRIGEMGSFDELMSKQGRFFELWNKQVL